VAAAQKAAAEKLVAETNKREERVTEVEKKMRVAAAEARASAAEMQVLSTTPSAPEPEPAPPNLLSCMTKCLGPAAGSQSEVLRRMDELAVQQRQDQRQIAEQQQQTLAEQQRQIHMLAEQQRQMLAEQQQQLQEQFAEQQRQLSGCKSGILRPSLDPEPTAHHSSTVTSSRPGESTHLLTYFKSRSSGHLLKL